MKIGTLTVLRPLPPPRRAAAFRAPVFKAATDFAREIIPGALDRYQVSAILFRGYSLDIRTIDPFYEANIVLTVSRARTRRRVSDRVPRVAVGS